MKSTIALDFKYGIRLKEEKKQKVNFYELGIELNFDKYHLGGGRVLSNLL